MIGANAGSVGDRASQFGEDFAVPLNSAGIGDAAVLFFIGAIEISAAALGVLGDRVVVIL